MFEEEDNEVVGCGEQSAAGAGAAVGPFPREQDGRMIGQVVAVAGGEFSSREAFG